MKLQEMKIIKHDNKIFASIENTENGEVTSGTVFNYRQKDRMVWAEYTGGGIVLGHLIGSIDDNGNLDMRYHHINEDGELMTGKCISTPEILDDGRIRIYEKWQWTCKDESNGYSIIEEINT